jgi:hypothetical protein
MLPDSDPNADVVCGAEVAPNAPNIDGFSAVVEDDALGSPSVIPPTEKSDFGSFSGVAETSVSSLVVSMSASWPEIRTTGEFAMELDVPSSIAMLGVACIAEALGDTGEVYGAPEELTTCHA